MSTPLAVDYGRGVSDAFAKVATFVPKLVAFLAILLVGYLLARVVYRLVDTILERIGFDRAVERGGIKAALAKSRYDASDLVAKIAYYAVLLFALSAAFNIWGPNEVSRLLGSVLAFLPLAVVAIIIVVVAAMLARAARELIGNALGGLSYGKLLGDVTGAIILGLGVIAALNQIHVATAVTTPILIFVLATLGGVIVVGVGGGLIRPMQARWENALNRIEDEAPRLREQAEANRPAPYPADTPYQEVDLGGQQAPSYDVGARTATLPGSPQPGSPGTSSSGGRTI